MKKTLKRQASKITALIKMVSMNTVKPFSEKPSLDATEAAGPGAPPVNHATELFERFTAEIIRERVVFTR